jgi:hypothetical protein
VLPIIGVENHRLIFLFVDLKSKVLQGSKSTPFSPP